MAPSSRRRSSRSCWRSEASSLMSPRWHGARDGAGSPPAREAVRHIVGRDPETLDEHGVARAAIELLAENFGDGVVGPALCFALFGLPGLFVYKTANTLDSMIGHRSPRYLAVRLGRGTARRSLEYRAGAARGAVPRHAPRWPCPRRAAAAGSRVMLRDAAQAPLAQCRLARGSGGGRARLGARRPAALWRRRSSKSAWLGDGRARATAADIARALKLYIGRVPGRRRRWCWRRSSRFALL